MKRSEHNLDIMDDDTFIILVLVFLVIGIINWVAYKGGGSGGGGGSSSGSCGGGCGGGCGG